MQNKSLVDMPPTPAGHFLLHFYAVIARLLIHLLGSETDEKNAERSKQFPFLEGYRTALRSYLSPELPPEEEGPWWDVQIAHLESQTAEHLPLRALIEEAGLGMHEVRLLIAAGLVEEDIRFGALFAALQEPLSARRPCMGLLDWLLSEAGNTQTDTWNSCRTLLDAGLLHVENRADPRAEWLLCVPPVIWDALRDCPSISLATGLTLQAASDFPHLEDLILSELLHERAVRIPELLIGSQITAIVLRGMTGSGRRTTLGAVARSLGRNVLLWETGTPGDDIWRLLGPLATLTGAIPLLRCDPAPGETLELPALPGYAGPVGVALGRSGGLRGPLIAHSLSLILPPPNLKARYSFWQATHVPVQPGALDEIVTRFLLTGGHIAKAALLAHAYAVLDNRLAITAADVQQATRALNRQALETLATPLEPTDDQVDLVVSAETSRELKTLEARCRRREALREHTGPALSQSLNRGVRALFSGPSGTGKTLAARVLATALQIDLYRIDLAAVVNKYIGETERNLNLVFSRAEELDVVLLLDEGDALMTSRTDVRNANDRYANLETNYLLQRLENYEGIVIITTNAVNRIDPAFTRRFDVIIDFAPPDIAERWMIWQNHLPQFHAVDQAFLQEVAGHCALTGGQIRNAALHATLLALKDGVQVSDWHLEAAVRREYRKAGTAYPLAPKFTTRSQGDYLRPFTAEVR